MLLALLSVRPIFKSVASILLGVGSIGYPLSWMLAGMRAPGLGSTAAAKESLYWLAVPASFGLVIGGLLTLGLVLADLFAGRGRSSSADTSPGQRRGMRFRAWFAAVLLASAGRAAAQSNPPAATAGIADNSFLLEEAYNQECGVVQHISSFARFAKDDWLYSFTQEWPVPAQQHQFSVTIPLQSANDATGFGDVALNYRYQALEGSSGRMAFAPRLSMLVPTGSSSCGLGSGAAGVQMNLPVSLTSAAAS